MNASKRIFLLTGLVSVIVIFWILPGVNTAKNVRYTRKFEDTDVKAQVVQVADTQKIKQDTKVEPIAVEEKKYKTESIEEDATWKDIDPEMYSRAIHYREELLVDYPLGEEDSLFDIDINIDLELNIQDTVYAAADTTQRFE